MQTMAPLWLDKTKTESNDIGNSSENDDYTAVAYVDHDNAV